MKKVILFFVLVFAVSLSFALDYTIELVDSYGDGWNGGMIDVLVNGVVVLDDITVPTGAGPDIFGFTVAGGDQITTAYTAGSWAEENEYQVKNEVGTVVAESGQGGAVPGNIVYDVPAAGTPGIPINPVPTDGALGVALSGDLTWDFGADTDTYDLWFGLVGNMAQVVTGAVAGASGTYAYSGLTGNSGYEWQVIAHNTADRLTTNGPVWTFTSICDAITTYPWTEDFENGGAIPDCWISVPSADGDDWKYGTSAGFGAGADHTTGSGYFAWVDDSEAPIADPTNLITPPLDLTGLSNPNVSFWYWIGDNVNSSELFIDVFDGTTWTDSVAYLTANGLWEQIYIDLNPYQSATTQIRFRAVEYYAVYSYQSDICMDDVEVFDLVTGILTGNVIKFGTRTPVVGAEVTIGLQSGITDILGDYTVNDVPLGTYTVTCEATDYETASQGGVVITDGATTTVDFALNWSEIQVTPGSFTETMDSNTTQDETMNIANPGGTVPLNYTICIEETSDGEMSRPDPERYFVEADPSQRSTDNVSAPIDKDAEGWYSPGNNPNSPDNRAYAWYEYANIAQMSHLTWATPERATLFDMTDFGLTYPVVISELSHYFYIHPTYPWPDSTFHFKIYDTDGATLLHESGDLEAEHLVQYIYQLPTAVTVNGDFYVTVVPVDVSGHPSSCMTDLATGHTYTGSAGNWGLYAGYEYIAAVKLFDQPTWLSLDNYAGQVPVAGNVNINVHFDTSGLGGVTKTADIVIESDGQVITDATVTIPVTLIVNAPPVPDPPTNPDPIDSATNVSLNPTLSWTNNGVVDSCLVWWGSPFSAIIDTVYGNTCTIPSVVPLSYSSTYYWKIQCFNMTGNAMGPEWSFTTIVPETVPFTEDFEGSVSDWVMGGTNSSWEIDIPTGLVGSHGNADPAAAHGGTKCAGNDLTVDGAYNVSENSYLMTPPLDCSALATVQLTFWRYLNVEDGYDGVYVEVTNDDGLTWNDLGHPLYVTETAWTKVVLDATAFATGNVVKFRWKLDSDTSVEYTGWNVDDILIDVITLDPPTNPDPAHLATNVSINPTLTWTNNCIVDSSIVWFGDMTRALVVVDTLYGSAATYSPATLAYNTEYQWKIVNYNLAGDNSATASTWTFTTSTGYNLNVTPADPTLYGFASQQTVYTVNIENSGIYDTDYDLTVSGNVWTTVWTDDGVPTDATITNTGTIVAATNLDFFVVVTVPASPGGTQDVVDITVTSTHDPLATETHQLTTTIPSQGTVCEDPLPLTLPAVAVTGNTVDYADDYNSTDISPSSSYLNGDDVVYQFTTTEEAILSGTIVTTGSWMGAFILIDCPNPTTPPTPVIQKTTSGTTLTYNDVLPAGTYFLIISSYPSPQSLDYVIDLDVAGLSAPANVLISNNGTNVSITWDAVTGATTYKVYSSTDPYGTFTEDTTGSFTGTQWFASSPAVDTFYRVTAVAVASDSDSTGKRLPTVSKEEEMKMKQGERDNR